MTVEKQKELEMCQYDIDAPAQGNPHPHAGILQKMKLKNLRILPLIQLDIYFMIIYLCIKYESNTNLF